MLTVTLPAGATPTDGTVRLYHDVSRNEGYTDRPLTLVADSTYSWDESGLVGRFYPTVAYAAAGGAAGRIDEHYVDLPINEELIVSPEQLATRARIPLPLPEDQREIIVEAILDAQADVEAYLGRAPIPRIYVQQHAYAWPDGWRLDAHGDDDVIEVISTEAEYGPDGVTPSDYFTVTYRAGLDPRNDPALRPIVRYVRAHALNSPEVIDLWQTVTKDKGPIKSISAEGQSVSFGDPTLGGGGEAGSGKPGSLPKIESLDRWRVAGRRVHQAPSRFGQWPHLGTRWP